VRSSSDGARSPAASTENIVLSASPMCRRAAVLHHHDGGRTKNSSARSREATKAGVISDIERMYDHFPVLKERQHPTAGPLSGCEEADVLASPAP